MAEIGGEIFGSNIYLCKTWHFATLFKDINYDHHIIMWGFTYGFSPLHLDCNLFLTIFYGVFNIQNRTRYVMICINYIDHAHCALHISLHFSAFLCISLHFFRQHYSLIIHYHSLSSLPLLFTIIHYYPCYSL